MTGRRQWRRQGATVITLLTVTALAVAQPAAASPAGQAPPTAPSSSTAAFVPQPPAGAPSTTPQGNRPGATPVAPVRKAPKPATGPTRYCAASVVTKVMDCFDTFRESMSKATGGLIKDAPLTSGPLSKALIDKINTTADPLMEIVYPYANFGGPPLFFYGGDCSSSKVWAYDLSGSVWDNAIDSFQTFNHCYATHYWNHDYTGPFFEWYANTPLPYIGNDWNDQISSITLTNGPSAKELLDRCNNGTDSCTYTPSDISDSYGGLHAVKTAINCSSMEQNGALEWSDTTGGSYTVGVEVSVTAGLKFLESFEVSIKATYGRTWEWSSTFTHSDNYTVEPGEQMTILRATKMETSHGTYELHFGSRQWGHYIWYVNNFQGTGPVAQDAGVTKWQTTPANCLGRTGLILS